jgi:hypothetical protein
MNGRGYLGYLDVDIIEIYLGGIGCESMHWIHRDQWQALLNTIPNIPVP